MDIIFHLVMIPIIIWFSYLVYAAFFTDLAERNWEKKYFMLILPEDLPSYVRLFKALVVFMLLSIITIYVLAITGVL